LCAHTSFREKRVVTSSWSTYRRVKYGVTEKAKVMRCPYILREKEKFASRASVWGLTKLRGATRCPIVTCHSWGFPNAMQFMATKKDAQRQAHTSAILFGSAFNKTRNVREKQPSGNGYSLIAMLQRRAKLYLRGCFGSRQADAREKSKLKPASSISENETQRVNRVC